MRVVKLLLVSLVSVFGVCHGADLHLPHSEVEGDPAGIVAGCVNVIRGTFSHHLDDIVIPGGEALSAQRSYVSGNWLGSLSENWTFNHVHEAIIQCHSNGHYKFVVPEINGGAAHYVSNLSCGGLRDHKTGDAWIMEPQQSCEGFLSMHSLDAGLTNTSTGEIGGYTHLKNQMVHYDALEKSLRLNLCNGGTRIFQRYRELSNGCVPIYMGCELEILPNGNRYRYGYDENGIRNAITLMNRNEDATFGSLIYDYSKRGDHLTLVRMLASDGRTVDYTFESNKIFKQNTLGLLTRVDRPNAPPESYTYTTTANPYGNYLQRIDGVDGRYKKVQYWKQGSHDIFGKKFEVHGSSDTVGRVMQLESPSGVGGRNEVTHRFFYVKANDNLHYTNVIDGNRHAVTYYFNKDCRLVNVTRNLGNSFSKYKHYSQQKYFWGDSSKNQHCNLVCKALCDGSDKVNSCLYLEYDDQHNVIAEHTWGILTGEISTLPKLNDAGIPQDNGCERYTKRCTYYDDSRHLKQTETRPNGVSTRWEYQPNTNLPIAILTMAHGQIVMREFRAYDANGTVVENITDDGLSPSPNSLVGITWRKITRTTPKASAPCLGLPEVVAQFYIDPQTKVEHSLGYVVNQYSNEGWMTSQAHHDAEGNLCYTLRWEYDSYGNPILEQDALGQCTRRRFDANSNKIYEQGPNLLFHTNYTYDLMNRLVEEEMVCTDGQRFSTAYTYDVMGNRISSTDGFGKTTRYTYDELDRLVATTIQGDVGEHSIRLEYDIAGNITAQTDIDGSTTRTQYNARTQPIRIDHPDATTERFSYTLEGYLKQHRAKNGSLTQYEHDPLGNVVSKVVYSEQGQQVFKETATYKGGLLTSKTDGNGNTTSYHYDGAGRLVETITPTGWSRTSYDALGRVHQTIDWYGPEEHHTRITSRQYDLLNRIIETRIEDSEGVELDRQLTGYNTTGQVTAVTTFTEMGPATTRTLYNAFGKVIKVIDALGHETLTHYNHRYINSNNRQVLQITQIDPMGLVQITTHSALGYPCDIIYKDSFGSLLHRTTQKHTLKGQLLERRDLIKAEGVNDREAVTEWIYDTLGRLVAQIEGKGSPLARQTYYSYNRCGQKELETYNDGVFLRLVYDGMGRQSHLGSSDGSVSYRFTYDGNGNVVLVEDDVHHTITKRHYDAGNRMVRETLANGLDIAYSYDGLDRVTHVELPDSSGIRYDFDAHHLNAVHRINDRGDVRLTHKYLTRDPSGRVTKTHLAGFAGEVTYSRDLLGRLQHLCHDAFEEEIPSGGYDAVGNVLRVRQRDIASEGIRHYTYDAFCHPVREEGVTKHSYLHDSFFNRLQKDGVNCAIDGLNQLVKQGNVHFTYDPCGRRSGMYHDDGRKEATYLYDALGRLIQVRKQNKTWKYQYDAFDRRVTRTAYDAVGDGFETDHYLYQEQCEIGKTDAQYTIAELRVLGEDAAAVAMEIEGRAYAPLQDHQSNLVALLSAHNGSVVEAYRYTLFGEEQCSLDDAYTFGDLFKEPLSPWRLRGKRVDPETQWVNFGAKHYDPLTGRYVCQTAK